MKRIIYIMSFLIIGIIPVILLSYTGESSREKTSDIIIKVEEDSNKIEGKEEVESVKQEEVIEEKGEEESFGKEDIVSIMAEDIIISEGMEVNGDVVGIGVNIDVAGMVKGDVVCINGALKVGDNAVIDGDIAVINSEMSISDSAKISGDKVKIRGFPFLNKRSLERFVGIGKVPIFKGFVKLIFTVVIIAIWILITVGFIAVFNKTYEKITSIFENRFGLSTLIGVLSWILIPVVVVILIASIIGIILVPVLLIFWIIGGFIGASSLCERLALRLFSKIKGRVYLLVIVGIALISAPIILGVTISIPGGLLSNIGRVITIIGNVIMLVVFTIGFGGILLAIFGKSLSKEKRVDDRED
ncbi:MAG: hypothetical protein ACUVWP_00525 [bacterium]